MSSVNSKCRAVLLIHFIATPMISSDHCFRSLLPQSSFVYQSILILWLLWFQITGSPKRVSPTILIIFSKWDYSVRLWLNINYSHLWNSYLAVSAKESLHRTLFLTLFLTAITKVAVTTIAVHTKAGINIIIFTVFDTAMREEYQQEDKKLPLCELDKTWSFVVIEINRYRSIEIANRLCIFQDHRISHSKCRQILSELSSTRFMN